jgi:hypothetical protein
MPNKKVPQLEKYKLRKKKEKSHHMNFLFDKNKE